MESCLSFLIFLSAFYCYSYFLLSFRSNCRRSFISIWLIRSNFLDRIDSLLAFFFSRATIESNEMLSIIEAHVGDRASEESGARVSELGLTVFYVTTWVLVAWVHAFKPTLVGCSLISVKKNDDCTFDGVWILGRIRLGRPPAGLRSVYTIELVMTSVDPTLRDDCYVLLYMWLPAIMFALPKLPAGKFKLILNIPAPLPWRLSTDGLPGSVKLAFY